MLDRIDYLLKRYLSKLCSRALFDKSDNYFEGGVGFSLILGGSATISAVPKYSTVEGPILSNGALCCFTASLRLEEQACPGVHAARPVTPIALLNGVIETKGACSPLVTHAESDLTEPVVHALGRMPSKGDDAFSSVSKKEENVCMTILYSQGERHAGLRQVRRGDDEASP